MSVTQAAPGIAVEVECSSKEGGEGGEGEDEGVWMWGGGASRRMG